MTPRPIGEVTARILAAVDDGHRYGADLMDATGLGSGTVYKVLRRLERRGHLRGRWEDPTVAEKERRPRRRFYELTGEGRRVLADAALRAGAPGRTPRAAPSPLAGEG